MPSSNVRDDLPNHQRSLLRQVAAAVIRDMGWMARTSVAPRSSRTRTKAASTPSATPVTPREGQTAPATPEERPALPASPYRPYVEADRSAEQVRERLRRNRGNY